MGMMAIRAREVRNGKAHAVDSGQGDAVDTVGRPHFLHHIVSVEHAVEVETGVADTVHLCLEESIDLAVVAVDVYGLLLRRGGRGKGQQEGQEKVKLLHDLMV